MKLRRQLLGVFPLLLVLLSCSTDVSVDIPNTALEIVNLAPDSTAVANGHYLHIPTSITRIRDQLLIIDNRQQCGFWFDLRGNPRGVFGRSGTGPGEMTNPRIVSSADPNGDFWLLSDNRLQRFDTSGVYEKVIIPELVIHHFDVAPDGMLLATSYANIDRGGVSLLSESGESIWTTSGRLEFEGGDAFYRLTNISMVCAAWDQVWQFFTNFNVIRVFNRQGVFLNEFALSDPYIEATDSRNRAQVNLLAQGVRFIEGRGVGPITIYLSIRFFYDSIWVVPQFLGSILGDSEKQTKFIFRLDKTGRIVERFTYRVDYPVNPQDIIVLSDHPSLSIAVIQVGPDTAEIAWLEPRG